MVTKGIYSKKYKYLFQQLKRAREESGLDQKAVSKKLKKTQSYISKIEHGQIKVDIFLLRDFAKIYKKNFEYFLPK